MLRYSPQRAFLLSLISTVACGESLTVLPASDDDPAAGDAIEASAAELHGPGLVAHFPINFPVSCNDESADGWISDELGGPEGTWSPTGTGAIGCVLIQGPGARSYLRMSGGTATVAHAPAQDFRVQITASALVQATDTIAPQQILAKGDAVSLRIENGNAVFELGFGYRRVWRVRSVTAPLPPGPDFTRITGTYDGRTMRLYADGEEVASQRAWGPILSTTRPLILGPIGRPLQSNGGLDDVRLYDVALSAADITALPTR